MGDGDSCSKGHLFKRWRGHLPFPAKELSLVVPVADRPTTHYYLTLTPSELCIQKEAVWWKKEVRGPQPGTRGKCCSQVSTRYPSFPSYLASILQMTICNHGWSISKHTLNFLKKNMIRCKLKRLFTCKGTIFSIALGVILTASASDYTACCCT